MSIKVGKYKATFAGMTFGTSKNGNEQIVIDLRIEDTVMSTILSFSDAAKPYSVDRLKALGWEGEGHALDESKLTNEVDVSVAEEEYQGQKQLKVSILTNGGRIVMKDQMSSTQKNDFLKRLTRVSSANGAAKKSAPKVEKSDADDSEIPF